MFRTLRLQLGLTQGEMVKKMTDAGFKVTVPMLSLFESGQVLPPEELADWIARQTVVNCDVPLSPECERLLEALNKASSDNPIPRESLTSITGLGDRTNRLLIGELRDRGYRIIDNYHGYYITHDEAELNAWLARFSSYAYTILNRKRAMLANIDGQIRM